jgi:hypothetical protein
VHPGGEIMMSRLLGFGGERAIACGDVITRLGISSGGGLSVASQRRGWDKVRPRRLGPGGRAGGGGGRA